MTFDLDKFISNKGTSRKVNSTPDTSYSRKHLTLHLFYTEYQQMDISAFDPNSFLDASVNEVNVKRPPLPAGRDFIAILGEPKVRPWKSKDDPTKQGIAIDVPHVFDVSAMPPDVQQLFMGPDGKLTVEKVTIVDGIMLDLTENGAIDNAPGKNGRQRQYREALDLNQPGQQFNWRMVQGKQIRSKIRHEPYQGEIYDKVASVAKV